MKRLMLALALCLIASTAEAQNIRLRPDGLGGYRIRGDYSGRLRSDGLGGYRGQVYSNYDDSYYYRVRTPHMQYNPLNDSYYPSTGARVGVYPWMFR